MDPSTCSSMSAFRDPIRSHWRNSHTIHLSIRKPEIFRLSSKVGTLRHKTYITHNRTSRHLLARRWCSKVQCDYFARVRNDNHRYRAAFWTGIADMEVEKTDHQRRQHLAECLLWLHPTRPSWRLPLNRRNRIFLGSSRDRSENVLSLSA